MKFLPGDRVTCLQVTPYSGQFMYVGEELLVAEWPPSWRNSEPIWIQGGTTHERIKRVVRLRYTDNAVRRLRGEVGLLVGGSHRMRVWDIEHFKLAWRKPERTRRRA